MRSRYKRLPRPRVSATSQNPPDSQISFALIHWWRTMEVRHVHSGIVARGLQGISTARTCEEDEGWPAGSAAFGAGGDLRWGDPHRGGEDWRRDAADHPVLGDAV